MAGDDELDAAGEWAASAPEEALLRLGAPRDQSGRARRPDEDLAGAVVTADQMHTQREPAGLIAAKGACDA
jgi:hypothetical protein